MNSLPRPFVRYLKRVEVLDHHGAVTGKGYRLIIRGAHSLDDEATNFYEESQTA